MLSEYLAFCCFYSLQANIGGATDIYDCNNSKKSIVFDKDKEAG